MIDDMSEIEVVVAHSERVTLRVGDVFLKIDTDHARIDREVEVMARAPIPTPEVLWRRPPVLALAAVPGAALDVLKAQKEVDTGRLAAIGYCFGGTTALELGREGCDFKAIVGFHSGLATSRPQAAKNIKGKVLVNIGAEDPIIPPEQRTAFESEMKAAGLDWRLLLYGGAGHSFTNPAADSRGMQGFYYHEATDRRSWSAMIELFNETLK